MERELERVQTQRQQAFHWSWDLKRQSCGSRGHLYPLLFEKQKLSICLYYEQFICCFNFFVWKFCLKSDFYYLSLKWTPFGVILCFIMQRHSCIFKCDLSVQILCGLWHTHKFNRAWTVYSKTKLDYLYYLWTTFAQRNRNRGREE